MRYTLELSEKAVQFLVDGLRRMPHHEVDAEIAGIRRQCAEQDAIERAVSRDRRLDEARELVEAADAAEALAKAIVAPPKRSR